MAIQITFLSVVLRKSSRDRIDPLSRALAWEFFRWEPEWFREDENLMATTFMCPADVRNFGRALQDKTGLCRGRDWAVVDMAVGALASTHWLEFQGGIGQASSAWLEGTEPGELVPTPSSVTGTLDGHPCTGRVVKLFGRDSNHDSEGHRADFGRLLPDWGGRDLWMVEVGPHLGSDGKSYPGGHLSVEAHPRRFEIIGQNSGS